MSESTGINEVVNILKGRGYPANASAIRYWESIGLIHPEQTEGERHGRRRRYSQVVVEKAYMLSLISALRKQLPHSNLPFRDRWSNFCEQALEALKNRDISASTVRSYQKLLLAILGRLGIESISSEISRFNLSESEVNSLKKILMLQDDSISEADANIAKAIEWLSGHSPDIIFELPHLASSAWVNARLQMQYLPEIDIVGKLTEIYKSMLECELQPTMDDLNITDRARLMKHEILSVVSGLEELREIRKIFMLKSGELVRILLMKPQTRIGMMNQLARKLAQNLSNWHYYYDDWLPNNEGHDDYVSHLRKQLSFVSSAMSVEALLDCRLGNSEERIGKIARELEVKMNRQKNEQEIMILENE